MTSQRQRRKFRRRSPKNARLAGLQKTALTRAMRHEHLEPRYLLTGISFGESVADSLITSGDERLFELEVTAGEVNQPFSIVLDGDQSLHPVLEIRSPSGDLLDTGASGTSVYDTRIADFVATAVGTYEIRVTSFDITIGGFELGVSDRPAEFTQAIPFSTFTADYLERLGDEDVFTFARTFG